MPSNIRVNGQRVVIKVDGEAIGTSEVLLPKEITLEPTTPQRVFGFGRSGALNASGTLTNVQWGRKYVDTCPRLDVVVTHYVKKPPRKPRSKKKRVQKKWQKHMYHISRKVTYQDVTITSVNTV